MIISLIGFMAAGKSTLGKQLSETLRCPFVDLDDYIQEKEATTIPEIFSSKGELYFRTLEESYLQDVLEDHIAEHPETIEDLPDPTDSNEGEIPQRRCTLVLSVGGGAVTNPVCSQLLSRFTYCIYLKVDLDTILKRLEENPGERPMLSQGIEKLYRQREPLYQKIARKTI